MMTAHTPEPTTARIERPAVLVVDDHPANILALESVLSPLPFRIVTAGSGVEALRLAKCEEFVLVLMDVHMPGLDGYQTVDLLRRMEGCREAAIVFLTAVHQLPEYAKRGYALGAVDYITKPFDPEVLRAKVSTLVSLYTRGRREERAHREELDRLKDLFLGAVGHDLRNPLNCIVMASRMMRMGQPCSVENHRSLIERIDRSARRMNEIIDDVLDLARGKFASGMPLKLADTDLATVCRTVVAELRALHPGRVVDVNVFGDARGRWDANRLARVVSNLVGNALKHTREPRVEVRIEGTDAEVIVSVHNGGPAIAQDVVPRLFEPFRRGNTGAEGLGLGLYIVREIARAHGGGVLVTSTAEEGTTFSVTLPRVPLEAAPPADSEPAPDDPQLDALRRDAELDAEQMRVDRIRLARARIRLLAIVGSSDAESFPAPLRDRLESTLREAQHVGEDAAKEDVERAATKAEQLIDLLTLGLASGDAARA